MAYGDNPVVVKDLSHTVTYEVDGYRPGFRGKIKQRRFLCVGGPADGAHRCELEHTIHDLFPRQGQACGYRRYNAATGGRGGNTYSAIWVWFKS